MAPSWLSSSADCGVISSNCYRHNGTETGEWIENKNSMSSILDLETKPLRIGHLNVLFPAFGILLKPNDRYDHQLKKLFPELSLDFICLNEASQSYLELMQRTPWVQGGFLSHVQSTPNTDHEAMIFSKQPFRCYRFLGIGTDRRYIAALVQTNDKKGVLVVAAHLSARENKSELRTKEFEMLTFLISDLPKYESDPTWCDLLQETISLNRIVICGDLNLHLPCETELIYDNGYHDTWLQTNTPSPRPKAGEMNHLNSKQVDEEAAKGYTWDPQVNTLINVMLPFDNRRMRLDRVLLKQGCKSLKCDRVDIFGNKPIASYLFPSDHFGLVAEFRLLSPGQQTQQYDETATEAIDRSSQTTTGFRTVPQIIFLRVVGVFALLTAGAIAAVAI